MSGAQNAEYGVSELGRDDDAPRRDWLWDQYRRLDREDAERSETPAHIDGSGAQG